jgi:hypothetical protein
LVSFAETKKVEPNEQQFAKSKRQIENILKAYIARGLYDVGAYMQVINTIDPTVNKAVELIENNTFEKLKLEYK